MSTQVFININEDGVPDALVVERIVGGTRVYHRVLPVDKETDIYSQLPAEVLDTVVWATTRFEEKVTNHKNKMLEELFGMPADKIEEAKAALEVLKDK